MKKNRGIKGITLIALVITIIVLLILAAVSIVTLTGENGILTRAENSKTQSNHSKVYEALKLEEQSHIIEQNDGKVENDLIGYFKEKQLINDNNVVNVQKLLSEKLSTGNGIGTTDIYKIEKVTEESEAITYELIYYGTKEGEKTKIGEFIENSSIASNDDMILVVNPSYTDGTIEFSINTDTEVTIDFGDGTVEQYTADMTGEMGDIDVINTENVKVASLNGVKIAGMQIVRPEGKTYISHEYQNNETVCEIKISGDLDDIYCYTSSLIEIKKWGNMNVEKICFSDSENLETLAEPTEHSFNNLDVSPNRSRSF